MNRKRYHSLEWSLYLKLIVGAVVVRVVVGDVKPPDNVWIMKTVICLAISLSLWRNYPQGPARRNPGGADPWDRTPGILSGLPIIVNRMGMIAFLECPQS